MPELDRVAEAYGDLKERIASYRSSARTPVTFGPTGAAKVLFALVPTICAPWDQPIREKLDYDGSKESYRTFLLRARKEIVELTANARRFDVPAFRIPQAIGRPRSTLPKLVDEYFWGLYTQEVKLPTN